MTDTACELRIISQESGKLSLADRMLIAVAAQELEEVQKLLIKTQTALIEERAQHIALNEVLLDIRKAQIKFPTLQGQVTAQWAL